ncbi:HlyD family efflux transporter periplasmic adaptor subunit [Chryseobacterium gambrini]|uniref:HlyD family efflux transporter periplasmic adaptor subunit n=1 Tax=Chryseobacterium gambrini TaxID=373672 RepID=A0AAJ1R7T4_9FLAO|nr:MULTISPECIES: HlyD family efflux transporter periplasmic adaptor subunit [Chryseobacterium]MDN4014807.1 HlyD family efflux transporter periplasmic adaptor subunit [Chryseobacterium gambrini]MDN4027893.1 HlyD family efflux transporter periplasmic adaptor subunit [Chryseobacterium gambrini]QWA39690.1 HlyD family efflux transporter periplasmic adaptor subunit [Chryseobacterium sp. ZHDP1]
MNTERNYSELSHQKYRLKTSVLALFFILFLFSCAKKEEVKPVVQDIKELVFASGDLEWENAYNLTAQSDGILLNADFEVGDKISKGKNVADIDNRSSEVNAEIANEQLAISNENLTPNSPQIQQLEQNIQFAENKYTQDKIQAERYERLYKSQSVAKVEYENMQLTAKNSLSSLNALKKQKLQILQQAEIQKIASKGQAENSRIVRGFNHITATVSGTVIKKLKSKGDYVRKGDIIATIADDQKVEAVLNVDENNIGKIKVGQTVYVKLNTDKNKVYNGKISEILSAFNEQTQSFICKVTFDNTLNASLFGTQLEANVLVGEKKNALLIPRELMGYGNKVNVKGKEQPVIIKSGIVSTDYVEVLSGITKDDVLLPLKP